MKVDQGPRPEEDMAVDDADCCFCNSWNRSKSRLGFRTILQSFQAFHYNFLFVSEN